MKTPRQLFVLAGLCAVTSAFSGPFTPGNLVVTRVGDGSAGLTSAATVVFLDEYTVAGTLVQSIQLPTAASGANRKLTANASSTSEMALMRSADGKWLTLGGYDADPGLASVSGTTSAANARVIGRVGVDGTINTSTALGDAYSTSNIRSVISTDGMNFWAAGTGSPAASAGVRATSLGMTISTQLSTDVTNTRYVGIYNGQLYVSSMSGAFRGVSTVGTGLPVTNGQTTTLLSGFDPATNSPQSAYGFFFSDNNTLYVADDRNLPAGGIQKWTFNGSVWSLQYTLNVNLVRGCRGLTGQIVDGQVRLYATQAGATASGVTDIVTVTDTGALAGFSFIATSNTNTAFRGIAWAPAATAATSTTGVSTIIGYEAGGDLDSVLASDDNSYCIFNDEISLVGQVQFDGTTSVTSPTSLTFTLEYQVYRVGLSVAVELYRFSNNAWVAGAGGVAGTVTDHTLVTTITNLPGNYVSGSGDLRARVTWAPINDEDPSQDGWLQCVDLAKWNLQ